MKAKIDRLLALQAKFPTNPILERAWMGAESLHDAMVAYLAIWVARGAEPSLSEPLTGWRANAISAARVWVQTNQNEVSVKLGSFGISSGATGVYRLDKRDLPARKAAPDFEEGAPSDAARRQAGEAYRAKSDGQYKGPRTVWPQECCGSFDGRFPRHW